MLYITNAKRCIGNEVQKAEQRSSSTLNSSLRFTEGGREGGPYLQIQNYMDIGKYSVRAQNYLSGTAVGTKTDTPSRHVRFLNKNSLALFQDLLGQLDLTLAGLEILDALTDKVKHLPICRTTLVLRNIMQLVMQFGVYFKSEMLVVFVSHILSPKLT